MIFFSKFVCSSVEGAEQLNKSSECVRYNYVLKSSVSGFV